VAAERARDGGVEEFIAATAAEIAAAGDDDAVAGYSFGAPLDQNYAGLARYWSKRGVLR
jgi:hypothetical protein